MAYDEALAERVRTVLEDREVREQKMFGGLAFMLAGHMCCGVLGDELLVRVGRDEYAAALARPGAHEMDFTGRPMRGFVVVAPEALKGRALRTWVQRGTAFVDTLPPRTR